MPISTAADRHDGRFAAHQADVKCVCISSRNLSYQLDLTPRSCRRCRSRKVKCSGTHPCDKCRQRRQECVFEEDKKIMVSEEYGLSPLLVGLCCTMLIYHCRLFLSLQRRVEELEGTSSPQPRKRARTLRTSSPPEQEYSKTHDHVGVLSSLCQVIPLKPRKDQRLKHRKGTAMMTDLLRIPWFRRRPLSSNLVADSASGVCTHSIKPALH